MRLGWPEVAGAIEFVDQLNVINFGDQGIAHGRRILGLSDIRFATETYT